MRSQFLAIAGSIAISVWFVPKADAQFPFLHNLLPSTSSSNDSESKIVSNWIYLDGRRLFQIAGPKANLTERTENIQEKLLQISQDYFTSPSKEVKVDSRTLNGLPVIYVNDQYLMTINSQDAKLRQVDDPSDAANQIVQTLEERLKLALLERQTTSLTRQGAIAAGTGLTMIIMSWGLYGWQRRSKEHSVQPLQPISLDTPLTTQLKRQQHTNLKEVKRRLFQLGQAGIWGGGILIILGLFPYTRSLQLGIFLGLEIPLQVGVVALGTYVSIRFSYALIDRFTTAIVSSGALLISETSERLQLRVSTISWVSKGIITIAWVVVGFLLALMSLGINIFPLLAGASLIGVAVSLASQSLIKDAINGFLIIVEDQYALGDVISVGNVEGLVENLNLRITQLRDSEGRLITIPNSEIKIVANLSSRWSRADLNIPVAYNTNVDEALKVIKAVGLEMEQDPLWEQQILETPEVLGVDSFGERGLILRVWIKTQPLKQWDVAREYRHRLKVALDKAGISIPVLQQGIWINDFELLKSHVDGKG
ncbi:MAG: mechanosensitive ion channel family protein [Stigonema ocellatum SAG 48.90 = DSM 106950]|nr:mechanosensitive ion channel family protein [Stigonema ocellatum SAG 48.90 = DSM 106950]